MSTGYYQKDKERRQKKACDRYHSLSEKDKIKKQKFGCEQYRNVSEKEKTKSVNMLPNDIEIFQKMKTKG